jgi:hypothetical protein
MTAGDDFSAKDALAKAKSSEAGRSQEIMRTPRSMTFRSQPASRSDVKRTK